MKRVENLHAHVYTPAGAEVGILTEIQDWSYNEPLDGAGSWSMTCRATAANAALIAEGRRVDVYGTLEGSEQLLSTGFLDSREPRLNQRGSTFTVGGGDRLSELGNRVIPALNVSERGWMRLLREDGVQRGRVRWLHTTNEDDEFGYLDEDRPLTYDNDTTDPTQPDLTTANGFRLMAPDWNAEYEKYEYHYLYVGADVRFDQVYFDISAVCTIGVTLVAQYYNGSGWVTLSITDGTYVAGLGTFRSTGAVTWTMPTDWVRNTPTEAAGNWFWVRFTSSGARTNSISVRDVRVYSDVPTTNALNLIMAHAPAGWKTSGYVATASEAYDTIENLSVLAVLERLREQIGGHYRAALVGGAMEIQWLTSFSASGITADGAVAESDATHVRIVDVQPRTDLAEYVSRVFPVCEGTSLAYTTRSSTGDYVLSKSGGYIRNSAAETATGRRDRAVKFTIDLQQDDSYVQHPALAANALFDLALNWLKQHDSVAEFYTLSVNGLRQVFAPGQTIDVVSTTVVDGEATITIDETLNVVAVNSTLDDGGYLAATLEVTTIERQALTDAEVLASAISGGSGSGGGGGGGVSSVVIKVPTAAGDADTVDGFHASQTPAPATILVLDNYGRLPPVAAGGFEWGPTYIRDYADSFGLSSVVSGGDDTRFWAGATFANRGSAPFRVTESGVVVATLGLIAGFTIADTYLRDDADSFGLSSVVSGGDDTRFWAGATFANRGSAPFRVTESGVITATAGTLGTLDVLGTLTLKTAGVVRSDNYSAGVAGWQVDYAGNAEFGNATIRGALRSAVFEKSIISAHAGSLLVAKSATKLASDYAVGGTLTAEDPPGGGWLFDSGDVVRLRSVNSAGAVTDTWITVTRSATTNQYTTTYQSGTNSVTYPAGTTAVDYGASGDGVLLLTADETNGPFYQVATHAGAPWSAQTVSVRLGNLNGSYGKTADAYGIGMGDYAGAKYLVYDGAVLVVEGGTIRTGAGAQRVEMSSGGLFGQTSDTAKTFLLANAAVDSWGGLSSLAAGSVVLGHNKTGSSALFWDPATGNLNFYGGGKASPNLKIMGADGALAIRRYVDGVANAGLVFRYNDDLTASATYDAWIAYHYRSASDHGLDVYVPSGYFKIDAGADAGKDEATHKNFMRFALDGTLKYAKLHTSPYDSGTDVALAFGDNNNTWAYLKATDSPGLKLAIGTGASPTEWADFRGHSIPAGWSHVVPQVVFVEVDVPNGGEQGILSGVKYLFAVLGSWNHNLAVSQGHLMAEAYKPGSGYINRYFATDSELVHGGDTALLLYVNSSGGVALKNTSGYTLRVSGFIFYFTA